MARVVRTAVTGLLTLATAAAVAALGAPPAAADQQGDDVSAVVSADCTHDRLQLALDNGTSAEVVFTVVRPGAPPWTADLPPTGTTLLTWADEPGTPYLIVTTASTGFHRVDAGRFGCGLRDGTPQMDSTTLLTTATPIAGLNGPDGTYTGTVASVRIPALATTNSGVLLATADARVSSTGDLPNNIQIVLLRSTDEGAHWSAPRVLVHAADIAEGTGDSSLLVDRMTGRVFLFFNYAPPGIGFGSPPSGSNSATDPGSLHVRYIYSDDEGHSWSAPVELNPIVKDPTWGSLFSSSGHGIQLASGRLLQPLVYRDGAGVTHAADMYSDDHGRTWHRGASAGTDVNESKAVQLGTGAVLQDMRPNAPGFRQFALSHDGGDTFGPMWTSTLLDPSCNADQLAYLRPKPGAPPTTDTMLFSNNADGLNRVNLTVRLSHDDGRTWPHAALLAPGAAGYSVLTVLADGSVGALYEVGATGGIVFDRFSLDWLRTG